MVVSLSRLINPVAKRVPEPTQRRPILNTIPNVNLTTPSRFAGYNQLYTSFWRRFKSSSELYGIVNILVTDIIGDRPEFFNPKRGRLGRNKLLEAERFWKENRVKESLRAILFDLFITGDGYGWKGTPSVDQRTKATKEILDKLRLKLKEGQYEQLFLKTIVDEDLRKTRKFDYIASSTMTIESTAFDITKYVQSANGHTVEFSPSEIIHFRLNALNGHVQGYSPMHSLIRELTLLYFVKGNMLAYLQNGGQPDILFTLENAQPNSDSFRNFHQQLLSYKPLEASHGLLLGTGKVNVTDLSFGKQRDMEYQNLALWVMSGLLFSFGIPVTRVPFLVGKSATSGDSGGMAEAGYQSMISEKQDEIEDMLNGQMFDELGFPIRFPRHYKQNEIREATTLQLKADTITKLQSIYSSTGKQIKVSKINEMLNIADDDLEEVQVDPQLQQQQSNDGYRQNMVDGQSVEKEPDNRKRADTKRNVANASPNKGMSV